MAEWHMLSVVGKDRPGIVARLTEALFAVGANLGEASMTRLGDSFAMMMMVRFDGDLAGLEAVLLPVSSELSLRLHVDPIDGGLHRHLEPNVVVRVFGADKAGIVAQVTGIMADLGISITSLETEVAGSKENPLYVMVIEAFAQQAFSELQRRIRPLHDAGYEVSVSEIDLMFG